MIKSHHKTVYEALGREPVHPFPARMAPGIALEVISRSKRPLRVLDPMMGSGTVVAVARSKGHKTFGIDIDPLAVLISKVWTTTCDAKKVEKKSHEVLIRAKHIFRTLSKADAYPRNADEETKRFIRYWFDDYARRQLASLSFAINNVKDSVVRDALWCGFSRLIITKKCGVSLAMDLSHSRPHKSFSRAPVKPFDKFIGAVERVMANCPHINDNKRGPAPTLLEGDARNLPLDNSSIDLVLTSPPYLNAIDYIRCSKFSLVWMGYSVSDARHLRSESIGSEASRSSIKEDAGIYKIISALRIRKKINPRQLAILERFVDDMRQSLSEVARVLSPKGTAVYVVGENTVRGTYIRNSSIVIAAANLAGLKLHKRQNRNLPPNRRYLPPPISGGIDALSTRMRKEVVLAFKKVA